MSKNCLIGKLEGQWIVQSANYSLLQYANSKDLLLNEVQWFRIYDYKPYLGQISQHLPEESRLNSIDMHLYCVKSKRNKVVRVVGYIILLYRGVQISFMIKLDQNFVFLHRFVIRGQSEDRLTIVSPKDSLYIVEKIYFLNRNLKVIRSTVHSFDQCIGTSFSSEIRIS